MAIKAASKSSGGGKVLTYGLIILAIVGIGGGIFVATKAFGGTPNPNKPNSGGDNTPAPTPPSYSGGSRASSGGSGGSSSSDSGFPLKVGSSGTNVSTLQSALDGLGAGLTIDGSFGAATQAALQKYGFGTSVANQAALDAIVNSQPTYQAAAAATAAQNANPVCMCSVLCLSPNQQACKTVSATCTTTPASSGGIWCDIKKLF